MRRFRTYPQIGGKRGGIPDGWVEVEYIESTGTQFIDTGVIGKSGVTVDANVLRSSVPNNNCYCGSYSTVRAWLIYAFGGNWYLGIGGYGTKTSVVFEPNKWLNPVTSISGGRYYITEGGASGNISNSDFDTATSLYLFGMHTANGLQYPWNGRGAATKIYVDGVLVRDYIPVRNTSTNEGAMCDVLTSTIYRNAGTGAFVVGPDKGLPYLREVKCLISDGTQIVKTGVSFSADSIVEAYIGQPASTFSKGQQLGLSATAVSSDSSFFNLGFHSSGSNGLRGRCTVGSAYSTTGYGIGDPDTTYLASFDRSTSAYNYNGEGVTVPTNPTEFGELCLFGRTLSGGSTSLSSCLIGAFKHTSGGVVVSDYTPVIDLSGRPCFYDAVSNRCVYSLIGNDFIWRELP